MNIATQLRSVATALALALVGCAAGGGNGGAQTHLSATQCQDLTDLRNKAPATHQRSISELTALQQAGYHPERRFDPDYPASLERAQQQVEIWYRTECPQARSG